MSIKTEDLKNIFPDIELSEDVIVKMKLMLEEKIKAKVEEELEDEKKKCADEVKQVTEMAEAYKQYAEQKIEEIKQQFAEQEELKIQEMNEKINAYADFIVEKFIREKEQQFVETNEYKRIKAIFEKFKAIFEQAGFELNNPVSIQENAELKELKENYNTLFEKYCLLERENENMQYAIIFEETTRNLAEIQKEKIRSLIEHVSFDNVNEFKKGLQIMIDQLTESKKVEENTSIEPTVIENVKSANVNTNNQMHKYLKVL